MSGKENGKFKNGKKDGEWLIFFSTGQLFRIKLSKMVRKMGLQNSFGTPVRFIGKETTKRVKNMENGSFILMMVVLTQSQITNQGN